MLFNTKWTQQGTLADFVSWLGEQDPQTKYDYEDSANCAVAQWLTARGCVDCDFNDLDEIGEGFDRVANGYGMSRIAVGETFGAAHVRGLAMLRLLAD